MMDDRLDFNGGNVRKADWKGICSGREFAERYKKASERRCSPKGKDWGEALAIYAIANPLNLRTGSKRLLLRMVDAAVWGWRSNYDSQKEDFTFDINTFEAKPR